VDCHLSRGLSLVADVLKFEFCLLSSRRLCADWSLYASVGAQASVAKGVLRCKTANGVVEKGVKRDAEEVEVRR
jgi:hypothetical protein